MPNMINMKQYFLISVYFLFIQSMGNSQNNSPSSIIGRWDITVTIDGKENPSWLEVERSGMRILVGSFVGPTGSARPISQVNLSEGKFSFSIPPQWEDGNGNLNFEATHQGDPQDAAHKLAGAITMPDGKNCPFTAVRAPSLKRGKTPVWATPIKLFNGKDLKGWHASEETNQWVVQNGILKSPKPGANL